MLQLCCYVPERPNADGKPIRVLNLGGPVDRMLLCRPRLPVGVEISLPGYSRGLEHPFRVQTGSTVGQVLRQLLLLVELMPRCTFDDLLASQLNDYASYKQV
jgi:hypothetical protein